MRWTSERAVTVLMVACLGLAGSACAQEADGPAVGLITGQPAGFVATPTYLKSVIDGTEQLPYRFEVHTSVAIGERSTGGDEPMITGSFDGEYVETHMDLGAMISGMSDEMESGLDDLGAGDLTTDMVASDEVMYLQSPFLSALANLAPADVPAFEVFDEVGDGWAKVDLTQLDDVLPSEAAGALGSGLSGDPRQYLEIVEGAGEVRELGRDEIDGEPVTGLAATVPFVDLMEAQGMDMDSAFSQLGGEDDAAEAAEAFAEILAGFTSDIEVWLDSDGRIRRLVVDLGTGMEQLGEDGGEVPDIGVKTTVDFFDHGDESIEVEVPDDSDAVDVTEAFRDLYAELTAGD